jgi:hypothetical protein
MTTVLINFVILFCLSRFLATVHVYGLISSVDAIMNASTSRTSVLTGKPATERRQAQGTGTPATPESPATERRSTTEGKPCSEYGEASHSRDVCNSRYQQQQECKQQQECQQTAGMLQ